MTADTTTATTITISWTSAGSEGVSYVVMWETDDLGGCSGGSDMNSTTITDGSTSYDITGLEEDSTYSITVIASNIVNSVNSEAINGITQETSESIFIVASIIHCVCIQLLLILLLMSVLLVHLLVSQSSGRRLCVSSVMEI